ncbi:MAG: carboxypeptidase family protein [Betaproteobacteria bacterium]|nr:carboxypeptidase family protein [Betaproteobacteria bacterium]
MTARKGPWLAIPGYNAANLSRNPKVKISSSFDSGAIDLIALDDPQDIRLRIPSDSHADFTQWFHFRLQGAAGQACRLVFENAGACTYAEGWRDYRAVASYDRQHWFRVPTDYDGQVMAVHLTPERDSVYLAYFEPYSWERHLSLLGAAESSPRARVLDLGNTVEGRDLNLVQVGDPEVARRRVWVIGRQHPGETMAEWFIEGMLERLLDRDDPFARRLLERAVFYVVPNMNPDGSVRGNLRTNAAGANLNREWMEPSIRTSPEVFLVRQRMLETGVDVFIDVHGDEVIPYNFISGCEMLPSVTDLQRAGQERFIAAYLTASPDFQDRYGYAANRYDQDALKLASKYVGHQFGCISVTLEMPFKDNADLPDLEVGWNGARSARLGAAALQPILEVL